MVDMTLARYSKFVEIFRFILVGGFCFGLGLALLYAFTNIVGWHYLLSMAISLLLVNCIGWLFNRIWTFNSQSPQLSSEFRRYFLVNATSALITMAMMAALVSGLNMNYMIASATVGLAMMFISFCLHKNWTFRKANDHTHSRS